MDVFYIYFLKSKKNSTYYIGQTNNIENRLKKHNQGLIKSTKHKAPFDLVYTESYNTRREAMFREKYLKSLSGFKEKKIIIEKVS